jgi:hypothetical protein
MPKDISKPLITQVGTFIAHFKQHLDTTKNAPISPFSLGLFITIAFLKGSPRRHITHKISSYIHSTKELQDEYTTIVQSL